MHVLPCGETKTCIFTIPTGLYGYPVSLKGDIIVLSIDLRQILKILKTLSLAQSIGDLQYCNKAIVKDSNAPQARRYTTCIPCEILMSEK